MARSWRAVPRRPRPLADPRLAPAFLMPMWLGAVGFANAPTFPNFAPQSLLWHAGYGRVLGADYVLAADRPFA